MIWNEKIECMDRGEMKRLQSERLRKTVERVYENTPSYRSKMQQAGIRPADIRSADDIARLPLTCKDDLRDNYPYGLFASPMPDIVRLHASSGTTGKPTVVGYTRNDLSVWSETISRCLAAYGTTREDVFHVSYGYGLFTGGLGLHYGIENTGGTVIPMSSGNTARQVQLLRDFGATVIACTPSYALYIAEALRDAGIDPEGLKLRNGIFGAEPWTESMRRSIESKLGIRAYNIYGLSEIMGPGVSHECECQEGSHIAEDHFLPEIIDPDTLEPLPYGSRGELVLTTITKEGMPLIRYRTRDLCSLDPRPCACGRTNVRMSRIVGRSDDMLIIRGVNVFPSQIESVILRNGKLEPHYRIIADRKRSLDTLQVQIEMGHGCLGAGTDAQALVRNEIAREIGSVIGLDVDVRLVEPRSIRRSEGKAQRVIDYRSVNEKKREMTEGRLMM